MNGEAAVAAPPPTRCPADPACRRSFGGTTAQKNLNSHLKNAHTDYYRTYVRPIKGPKKINHDAYIRQKQKDPEKVKRHRLLARLRKQARKEQVECMKRQRSPSPPRAPDQGLTIDTENPYFVLESECGVFVGHTKRDLMNCDVVKMLDGLATAASRNITTAARIQNAIAVARSRGKEGLVADYYRYRRALQDAETFSERQASYHEELLRIRERRAAPEGFLDEQAVQRRVEELLGKYNQRAKTGGESTSLDNNGNHDKMGEQDGEGEPEEVIGDSRIR